MNAVGFLARWLTRHSGIFLLFWLLLMVAGRGRLLRDPGTFWHTVAGERMLESGQLIRHDSFSFSFEGRPWIAQQWLGECLMALVHRFDGLDSLLLVTATILALLYSWVAARFIRAGLHCSLALTVVVIVIAASASHFHVRPHLATIAGMGLTMAWLCDFESQRIGPKRLAWLIPGYCLWANLHGGVLGGLATMVLALAGWIVVAPFETSDRAHSRSRLLAALCITAACGLSVLVNPYGLELLRAWLSILDSQLLPTIIVEHAPLQLFDASGRAILDGWFIVLVGGMYLAMLLSIRPGRWRITWLLPAVWLYLAFSRVRHGPLFAISAAIAMADMLPDTLWAARAVKSGGDLFRPATNSSAPFGWQGFVAPVVLCALGLGLQTAQISAPVIGHGWARLDAKLWPVDLRPELERLEPNPAHEARIFNDLGLGGFLIYYSPGYRVFVDDRCELYGEQWLLEYEQAKRHATSEKIDEWQQIYGRFDFALLERGSDFEPYFRDSPAWRLVKRGEAAAFYQRRSPG